jgi:hypothetical protein
MDPLVWRPPFRLSARSRHPASRRRDLLSSERLGVLELRPGGASPAARCQVPGRGVGVRRSAPVPHRMPVPTGRRLRDDARVRWSGSPRRGARRLHAETPTAPKACGDSEPTRCRCRAVPLPDPAPAMSTGGSGPASRSRPRRVSAVSLVIWSRIAAAACSARSAASCPWSAASSNRMSSPVRTGTET